MSDGIFTTFDPNVIRFKCTKCGYIDAVEIDIVWECFDVKRYKGKRSYYCHCVRCNSPAYPVELPTQNKNHIL